MADPLNTEMLRAGAKKIAAAIELGLSEDELMDLLARGAEKVQRNLDRRARGGRVAKPIFNYEQDRGKLRPAKDRMRRPPRNRPAGQAPANPTVTEEGLRIALGKILQRVEQGGPGGQPFNTEGLLRLNQEPRVISEARVDAKDREGLVLEEAGFLRKDVPPEFEEKATPRDFEGEAIESKREYLAEFPGLRQFENPANVGYVPGAQERRRFGAYGPNPDAKEMRARGELVNQYGGIAHLKDQGAMVPVRISEEEGRERNRRERELGRAMFQAENNPAQDAAARDAFQGELEGERRRRAAGDFEAETPGRQELRKRAQGYETRNEGAAIDAIRQIGDAPVELFGGDIAENYVPRGNLGSQAELDAMLSSDVAIAGSNTPDSAQVLNAPQRINAVDFVSQQVNATGNAAFLGNRQVFAAEGGREGEVGGAAAPYQQIGAPLRDIDERIGGLVGREFKIGKGRNRRVVAPFTEGFREEIGPIRGIEGLQKAVDAIGRVGREAGLGFYRVGEGGTREAVKEPGVYEVLDFLKMNRGAQQRLGLALEQVDLGAQNVGVEGIINEEAKRRFAAGEAVTPPADIVFGYQGAQGRNPEAEVAQLAPDKARKFRAAIKDRVPERAGRPAHPEAMYPFIGAVAGEGEAPVAKADIAAIDEEVRGRVMQGGAPERQVRDEAIERMQRRGMAERGKIDEDRLAEIVSNVRRLDRGIRR